MASGFSVQRYTYVSVWTAVMDWDQLMNHSKRDWSKPFNAQYEGECAGCGDTIETGDEVRFADDELVHVGCEE